VRAARPRPLTRRALLARGAAGAATLSIAEPALARVGQRPVASRFVGALDGTAPPLRAPCPFALTGVQWSRPRAARIELRAMALDGHWTPWVEAAVLGHDPDGGALVRGNFGEPLWTGPAVAVQLRSDRAVAGLRVHFVSVAAVGGMTAPVEGTATPGATPEAAAKAAGTAAPGAVSDATPRAAPRATTDATPEATAGAATAAESLPLAHPILNAGPGQPPILARRAWAQGQAPPGQFAGFGTVKLAFVHHTVNPNGYSAAEVPALLRGIFVYHRYVRGYFDIAYNFLIDAYGRIWEGRAGGIDMPVIGAHAGGYNAESTGVAMLGDFMDVVPPPTARRALEHLLAWKLALHGVPARGRVTVVVDPASAFYTPFSPGAHVSLPRVAGHRDGDLTDCPGNALYGRLPVIREQAISLQGVPARVRVRVPAAPIAAGAPTAIEGVIARLDRVPLGGAELEIEQYRARTAATIATARADADGHFVAQLAFEHNALVRALHRAAPASVSDWVALAVAPVLTLSVRSTQPLIVDGTVAPPKRYVVVQLYRAGSAKALARRRVRTAGGRLTAVFRVPSGDYVVIARTADDADNAAGSSPPLTVTVP
jgi:hypothetical protein